MENNIILNKNFNNIQFNTNFTNEFSKCYNNLYNYTLLIKLDTTSSDFITLNIGDTVSIYIFPLNFNAAILNVGSILISHDNNAMFIINSKIEKNKFNIKLIKILNNVETTFKLFNNIKFLFYNTLFEKYIYSRNVYKVLIYKQKRNFTKHLNNNNEFVINLLNKINIFDSSNNIFIDFNFLSNKNDLFDNMINKFYLNVWIYDYNDFKYIYHQDFKKSVYSNQLTNSMSYLNGLLQSFSITTIKPHLNIKLVKGNVYNLSTNIINNFTKFKKTYDNNKLIFLFQLSLIDKSINYDQLNNVESSHIYLVY